MSKPSKVLFLFANKSVRSGKADPVALQNLLEAASAEMNVDCEIYVSFSRSLSYLITNEEFVIRDHRNHMDLNEYDFVYFRKAGASMQQMQTCAYYLRDHGIPFYDQEILWSSSRNKLSQMAALKRQEIPIPTTLFCRNRSRSLRLIRQDYSKLFQFPLIAKATGASRGDANYLISDINELEELFATSKRHFIIQHFIPNDGDYRFFIAGGVVRGAIHRKAAGSSHLNNTSRGADATLINLDTFERSLLEQVTQAAHTFKRDCAGVDVIFDKKTGQSYFLEVNRAPQIEDSSFENEKAQWLLLSIQNTILNSTSTATHKNKNMGRFETVYIFDHEGKETKIVAKVDTGADTSSIHADNIRLNDDTLSFSVGSLSFQTDDFSMKKVKSSNGLLQERYMVNLKVRIGNECYGLKSSLTDRSQMNHDMLLGRRFLRSNKFIVDVSKRYSVSGKKVKV